jgi:hypothetical protein
MLQAAEKLDATDLLSRGFFHDRLIPPLMSDWLKDAAEDVLAFAQQEIKAAKKNNWRVKTRSRFSQHSVPKRKHLRRRLCIPNPRQQAILCSEVAKHWRDLRNICKKSPISLTTPRISSTRAIEGSHDSREIAGERALRSIGARYLLQTDFARFYPSIYTHSIPWAIHGKNKARADRKSELYGNRLDLWIRETQDKQTGGIPIGPDTSFLIAEVIASRIDTDLQRLLHRPLRGTRYIDDYHLYFDNLADAEKALAALHRVAAAYELEVNDAKTEIVEMPEALDPSWKTQLRAIRVEDGDTTSIKALFDRGFELAKQYPHDSVLTYVAKKIQNSLLIDGKNWETCEPLLLRACFGEPTMLPILLNIYEGHPDADTKRLTALIEGLCAYHGPLHQGFEIAWSLWLAKNLNLSLSKRVGEVVSKIDDDVVALAALDLRDAALLEIEDVSLWSNHLSSDALYSEHWLLAYEAREHRWLTPPDSADYIGSDDFFSILREHGVLFYDVETEWDEGYHEPGYSEEDEENEDTDEDDE